MAASCPLSPAQPQAWTTQGQHAAYGYEQTGLLQQQQQQQGHAHPAGPLQIPQNAMSAPCTADLKDLQTSKTAPGNLQGISALRVLLGQDSLDVSSSYGSDSEHSLPSPQEECPVHNASSQSTRAGSKGSMDSLISTSSSISSLDSETDAAADLQDQQACQDCVNMRKVTWVAKGFLGKSLSFSAARNRERAQMESSNSTCQAADTREGSAAGHEGSRGKKLAKLKAAATGVQTCNEWRADETCKAET
jgi:hypothetical protein